MLGARRASARESGSRTVACASGGTPVTVLPQLERMLGDAAQRLAPASTQLRGRWRSRRALVVLAVLVCGGGSAAWAAGVFETGAPITTQAGFAPVAKVGWGAPVIGSYKTLPLRVPDPASGPPWGLGVFRTTQGLACVVAGRVVNGRIGALGIDYTFGDDNEFHPLLPAAAIVFGCAPPDADGHLYLEGLGSLAGASGEVAGAAALGQRPTCLLPGDQSRGVRCPRWALRTLFYGFLGPDARDVSYTYSGVRHVEPVSGPEGGYLLVLPAPAGVTSERAVKYGDVLPAVAPRVTYHGGLTCTLASADLLEAPPGPCQAVGYVTGPLAVPSRASLATVATVRYRPDATVGLLAPGPTLTVSFTARADTAERCRYVVQLRRPNTQACRTAVRRAGGGIPLRAASTGAIRAGETVTLALPLQPLCTGRYSGTLTVRRAARWPAPSTGMNRLGVDRAATIPITSLAKTVLETVAGPADAGAPARLPALLAADCGPGVTGAGSPPSAVSVAPEAPSTRTLRSFSCSAPTALTRATTTRSASRIGCRDRRTGEVIAAHNDAIVRVTAVGPEDPRQPTPARPTVLREPRV